MVRKLQRQRIFWRPRKLNRPWQEILGSQVPIAFLLICRSVHIQAEILILRSAFAQHKHLVFCLFIYISGNLYFAILCIEKRVRNWVLYCLQLIACYILRFGACTNVLTLMWMNLNLLYDNLIVLFN